MIEPQIIKQPRPNSKRCSRCKCDRSGNDFVPTKSWFYADGLSPVCNICIKEYLIKVDWNWDDIDKLCQMLDIPFLPQEFEDMRAGNPQTPDQPQSGLGDEVFSTYAKVLQEEPYEEFGWKDYFERFKELRSLNMLEDELPELHERRVKKMREDWGMNYDEEQLTYLENLYSGLLATQHVAGALQVDQARKVSKISLAIDECIRMGEDFSKLMQSYDKMIKTADFTPKNVKNENDFDSFGEVAAWLERRGWINEYHDDVSKDIVDEVIHNLQAFNQRLYINESNIGEEIDARIEALKIARQLEDPVYGSSNLTQADEYENEGYTGLIQEEVLFDEEDEY